MPRQVCTLEGGITLAVSICSLISVHTCCCSWGRCGGVVVVETVVDLGPFSGPLGLCWSCLALASPGPVLVMAGAGGDGAGPCGSGPGGPGGPFGAQGVLEVT